MSSLYRHKYVVYGKMSTNHANYILSVSDMYTQSLTAKVLYY